MRAMIYESYGGPENLELVELPAPSPGKQQLAIRVIAASINPIDWKRAKGQLRFIQPATFPSIPGYDVAGEVLALGPGVTDFAIGARVHARIKESKGGACAEVAIAGVDVTAEIPDGMSFAEAAGLPLAGMTALQGLRDGTKMPLTGATSRILVVGASGGVGHLAVQIAHAAGAFVVGVCSGRNVAMVRELGANEVIDYTAPDPFAGQAPFDIVLDCVGGEAGKWLPRLVAHGRYASCLPSPEVFARGALNVVCAKKVTPVLLSPRAADLRLLDDLVRAKKLKVVIDSRFPLAELQKAWERSISGRAAGKIIVDVA